MSQARVWAGKSKPKGAFGSLMQRSAGLMVPHDDGTGRNSEHCDPVPSNEVVNVG
jgi:hypothetical protein